MRDTALGPKLHGILFRKGIVNNFSDKMRGLMLPKDLEKAKKMVKVQRAIARLTRQIDVKQLKKGVL